MEGSDMRGTRAGYRSGGEIAADAMVASAMGQKESGE